MWNYRVVDLSVENDDDPWLTIQEAYYDDSGLPEGYADVVAGSETLEGLRRTLQRMLDALDRPVLSPSDFNRSKS
jgi:hypothetical protein